MNESQPQISLDLLKEKLSDRWWRLNNLYYIIDAYGNKIIFKPNDVQKTIHDNLHNFNIIPKARQLGCTTFIAILFLDQVLFSKNRTAGIICHRIEDVRRIFSTKIRFAWNNLHPWLKEKIGEPKTDSANELVFPNGSSIFTSMTTRSSTVQMLHISEFGYICKNDPQKAEEIVTGALNSIEKDQLVVIESTARGSDGYFYNYVMQAQKNQEEGRELTPLDMKLHFFPWWIEPRYKLEGDVNISEEKENYFRILNDKYGIQLSKEQKNWYVKKEENQRLKGSNPMLREYPSFLEEAFMVSLEGSYYGPEMSAVYRQNRIMTIPFDPMLEVDSWWDIGVAGMVIILTQSNGPQIRFIDVYLDEEGGGFPAAIDWLNKKAKDDKYRFGAHHIPWDGAKTEEGTGTSRSETLYKLGLRNVVTGKQIAVDMGIEKTRMMFPRFYFNEHNTKQLTDALRDYRRKFNKRYGFFEESPEKSHPVSDLADAVRLLACEWREKVPELYGQKKEEEKSESFF